MSDTCGHPTADGGECGFKGKYPDGRCGHHTEETDGPRNLSTLEEHPEIVDLIGEEIERGATISEALAEIEEKMDIRLPRSTHDNWMAKGKRDTADDIFKEYRREVRRARNKGARADRRNLKQQCIEKGDTRTWYKIHKEQYGDLYDGDGGVEETTPPFAIPEQLIEEWQ